MIMGMNIPFLSTGDASREGTSNRAIDKKRTFIGFEAVLSYIILACGLWTVIIGAKQIITAHSLVPMGDEWEEIDAVVSAPHEWPAISWLWTLHNEHRVF